MSYVFPSCSFCSRSARSDHQKVAHRLCRLSHFHPFGALHPVTVQNLQLLQSLKNGAIRTALLTVKGSLVQRELSAARLTEGLSAGGFLFRILFPHLHISFPVRPYHLVYGIRLRHATHQ